MNKDIKVNLDEYVKARKNNDKVQQYILQDILLNECGYTLQELETYYQQNK